MGQTSYNFQTALSFPGAIFDLAPKQIVSRVVDDIMKVGQVRFGMGVYQGANPGKNVIVPDVTAIDTYEGVVVNGLVTEHGWVEGEVNVRPGTVVGIMRYGVVCVLIDQTLLTAPAYNDDLYLVTAGNEAGRFTNEPTGNTAVKGRFLGQTGKLGDSGYSIIELFNQAQV